MSFRWDSSDEAVSAAQILCKLYTDGDGALPGDLLGCYLTQLKTSSPAVVAAFYRYVHATCPRLMDLFVKSRREYP